MRANPAALLMCLILTGCLLTHGCATTPSDPAERVNILVEQLASPSPQVRAEAETRLLSAANDRDPRVRQRAVSALVRLGERAISPLSNALKDEDPPVRAAAARALGDLKDPGSVEVLVRALADKEIWECARDSLVKIGKPSVEALMQCLKEEEPRIRGAAIHALGQIGDPRAAPAIAGLLNHSYPGTRAAAVEAYATLAGASAAESLIKALSDPHWEVRFSAARGLVKVPTRRAIQPLVEALRSHDTNVQAAAAQALGEICKPSDTEAVNTLIAALGHESNTVRYPAALALGKIGDPRALKPLSALLRTKEGYYHTDIIQALGRLGDKRAVEPLLGALASPEGSVQVAAAEALGNLGDLRAIPPLAEAMKGSRLVAEAASSAIERIVSADPTGAVPALINLLSQVPSGRLAARLLGKVGDMRALEPLLLITRQEDAYARLEAAKALGKLPNFAGIKALIGDLTSGNPRNAYLAMLSLRHIGDPAVEPLVRVARSNDPARPDSPLWVASTINRKLTLELLAGSLKTNSPPGRDTASWALGQLGSDGADTLVGALRDNDPAVREAAARGLAGASEPRAAVLIRLLNDDAATVRAAAADALGCLRDGQAVERAVEPLIAALKDASPGVRAAAARALGYLCAPRPSAMVFPADTRPVKALIACLKDNEMSVREASASALRNTGLGDRESPEPVVQALKDSEWQVRAAAVRLLGGFCYRPEVQRAILGVLQDANEREEVRLAAIDALVCPDRLEILRQVWRDTRMPARLRDAAWWRLREVYQFMAPPRRADGHPPA